jgi:hypothetical protein
MPRPASRQPGAPPQARIAFQASQRGGDADGAAPAPAAKAAGATKGAPAAGEGGAAGGAEAAATGASGAAAGASASGGAGAYEEGATAGPTATGSGAGRDPPRVAAALGLPPLFDDLLPRVLHCCWEASWGARLGGVAAVRLLWRKLPAEYLTAWLPQLLRALMVVTRHLPEHSVPELRQINETLSGLIDKCYGPGSPGAAAVARFAELHPPPLAAAASGGCEDGAGGKAKAGKEGGTEEGEDGEGKEEEGTPAADKKGEEAKEGDGMEVDKKEGSKDEAGGAKSEGGAAGASEGGAGPGDDKKAAAGDKKGARCRAAAERGRPDLAATAAGGMPPNPAARARNSRPARAPAPWPGAHRPPWPPVEPPPAPPLPALPRPPSGPPPEPTEPQLQRTATVLVEAVMNASTPERTRQSAQVRAGPGSRGLGLRARSGVRSRRPSGRPQTPPASNSPPRLPCLGAPHARSPSSSSSPAAAAAASAAPPRPRQACLEQLGGLVGRTPSAWLRPVVSSLKVDRWRLIPIKVCPPTGFSGQGCQGLGGSGFACGEGGPPPFGIAGPHERVVSHAGA